MITRGRLLVDLNAVLTCNIARIVYEMGKPLMCPQAKGLNGSKGLTRSWDQINGCGATLSSAISRFDFIGIRLPALESGLDGGSN